MVRRCTNPKHEAFELYGGAGVMVCERWLSFENFIADMGLRPEGTTLGRILDMGNYEKGNAFWQTRQEQSLQKSNKCALLKLTVRREIGHEIQDDPKNLSVVKPVSMLYTV